MTTSRRRLARSRVVKVKRVYERPSSRDGLRFLVERLWPRGLRKAEVKVDGWVRDVAPSSRLRRWFGHDPSRWVEFQRRYFRELSASRAAWTPLVEAAERHRVTLIYSSHDTKHNNAVALLRFLRPRILARHRLRSR